MPPYQGFWAAGTTGTPDNMNAALAQRDTFANRPAAAKAGVWFISTNGKAGDGLGEWLYVDDGAAWQDVGRIVTDGAQTYTGVKTFGSIPVLPGSNPTVANEATRKSYVDNKIITDFQRFTASGTWTKPAGVKVITIAIGGAGGG